MFLAIDIGNSKIKTALFSKNKIIAELITDSLNCNNSEFYCNLFKTEFENFPVTECAIISVADRLENIIKEACDKAFNISSVILDTDCSKSITIETANPKSAGMDRVANVYTALDYPLPAIIVDIGTAITFDILSSDKKFTGGIIMPGINMQLKALTSGTSKLPAIVPKASPSVIGNDTETCILSGVVRGTAAAIDGLLEQCVAELGDCKTIVLTGGQADLVSKYMKYPFSHKDTTWTLKGIKNLYDECH